MVVWLCVTGKFIEQQSWEMLIMGLRKQVKHLWNNQILPVPLMPTYFFPPKQPDSSSAFILKGQSVVDQ